MAATELKEGDQVILVCDSKNVALCGTYNGFYNNGLEVAPVDGVIENPDSTIVWTVGKEGEFYTFSYDGKKIGMGDSYTSMPLDAVNYKWQVEAAATEGCFYVKNLDRDPAKAYYMQWRDTNSSWSGYHTLDEALMAIRFYVKTAEAPHTHTWDDGVITTEPTCTEAGVKTFTCTGCGETKTEPVDALGHNYVAGVCSRCGDLLSSADSIVIYYTNDVHTYVDKGLSYDNIAALKKETAKTADGVLLLDAGDHIQGTAYGALDEGEVAAAERAAVCRGGPQAVAGHSLEVRDLLRRDVPLLRVLQDRPRERVLAAPLEGIGQREKLVFRNALRRENVRHLRFALGNGSRLIQHNCIDLAGLFQ